MKHLTKLKLVLLQNGLSQREVARKSRINEGLMSLIVSGRYIPDHQQMERLAAALQLPKEELFEKVFRI